MRNLLKRKQMQYLRRFFRTRRTIPQCVVKFTHDFKWPDDIKKSG
jgi:hypothetical protein